MRVFDIIILLFLFTLIGIGLYVLWANIPGEKRAFEKFSADFAGEILSNSTQFYPNMRYRSNEISYVIDDTCDLEKINDVKKSFSLLEEKTTLRFFTTNNGPELRIFCSEIAPTQEEEGHFVAGEGGPSEIINTSSFNVVFSGRVSLFREDKCDEPKIALHEILHALGFDHNNNSESIMFPVTNCEQVLDDYIIEEINELYAIPTLQDLAIKDVTASRAGRYLDFRVSVGNVGLAASEGSSLGIYADGKRIRAFELGQLEIGITRILDVENLRAPRNTLSLEFIVETTEPEISKENNKVEISLEGE